MKTLRYFTAAVVLVAWTACTNDDLGSGDFANDPDAVHITATVGDLLSRSNPIADNAEDRKKFNAGDKIKVGADGQSHIVYTYDGTNWIPEDGKYLRWNRDVHEFSAYYPDATQDGIKSDQRTIEGLQSSDLMWDLRHKQTKTPARTITLNFQRRTARIVISKTIDWGTQYDNYIVTGLQVHTLQWGGDLTVQPYCEHTDNYYAIVNACDTELKDKTFLTIKIKKSDDEEAQEITHTVTGIPVLEEGKSYQFALRIGRDKAEISNVTVEDWQTGKVVDEDKEATEAPDYEKSEANGVTTYHVYTAKGLQDVNAKLTDSDVTAATLTSNIKLEGNITLPAVADGESNWKPIGFYSNDNNNSNDAGFTGVFDGNGYTITGLVIHSANSYQGLFGYLNSGGIIKNLTLANCSIKGGSYTGAFVGWNANSSIENCHLIATKDNEVRIESESLYLGGIVGQSFGTVSGCSLTANGGSVTIASTNDNVGGIVGNAGRDSYTSGCQVLALNGGTIAITGNERTGGIVGDVVNGKDAEMMSDCHITNNNGTIAVTGTTDVGGAAGYIHCISNSFVQNCHVTGVQVKGTTQVGGFTGRLNKNPTIVGSNTVKDCTVTGTDAATVKWDVGKNENTSHTPEITDGGENKVDIVTE